MAQVELDDLDRHILRALQANNLTPADRLGERIGLSASAVQRRAKRLRSSKVIAGDVAVVDPKLVGQGSMFIVEVTMERESTSSVEDFQRRMRAAPEVQQCYYVTGEADFILIICAPDMEHYEKIVGTLLFDERNVRKLKTAVVLNRVKATLSVPIQTQ